MTLILRSFDLNYMPFAAHVFTKQHGLEQRSIRKSDVNLRRALSLYKGYLRLPDRWYKTPTINLILMELATVVDGGQWV